MLEAQLAQVNIALAREPLDALLLAEFVAQLDPVNADDFAPLPDPVVELRAAIARSGAVLFCTPEYAGALPGALKNLLEWTVGGPEMYRRPVAWINASGSASPSGGADAHESLRKVLGYIHAESVEAACVRIPLARSAIDDDGLIGDRAIRGQVLGVLASLADYVAAHPREEIG